MEEIIADFIDWARENSPDAWYIFENPEEAIEKYIEYRKNQDEEE